MEYLDKETRSYEMPAEEYSRLGSFGFNQCVQPGSLG